VKDVLGVYGIKIISQNALMMSLFSLIADFRIPSVKMLPGGLCYRTVDGRDIISYRDGFRVFYEIFDNKPYEKYSQPKSGDMVLDLGAYVGMFSYRASQLVGDTGSVIAVEPSSKNYKLL